MKEGIGDRDFLEYNVLNAIFLLDEKII